jgi:signal transduction histidine kinase
MNPARWLPTVARLAGALVVMVAIAVVLGWAVLHAPARDLQELALFLLASGGISLAFGFGMVRAAGWYGRGGIGLKVALGGIVGVLVAFINIVFTALLMFISAHDLGLLILLLLFSALLAAVFAQEVARTMSASLQTVAAAVRGLGQGDLTRRVEVHTGDEIEEVAAGVNALAERLDQATRRQVELEAARRELVAAVSHDLRTPVATIRAMVEAINDGVVDDEATRDRYLRTVQSEIQHLGLLIDDLFELARIEAGVLRLQIEPCSVADLISDTLRSMEAAASRKGVRLEGRVPDELAPVPADAARLQRVLYNLVQNAIRHTPADGSVVLEAFGDADGVRVAVRDTGEGLAPQDLPRVFERSYRGEASRSRESGGAGLGLSIARGIVEAHGGQIWAENNDDRGARFTFLLPLGVDSMALPG